MAYFTKQIKLFLLCILAVLLPSLVFSSPGETGEPEDTMHITLQQAIERALKANRQLTSSLYSIQSRQLALATDESEFDFKYFPVAETGVDQNGENVGVGLSLQKKFVNGTTAVISPRYGSVDGRYTGMISLALTIPLLKGRGSDINLDAIHSSQHLLQKAKNSHHSRQEQVVLDTIAAVYNIITQRELEKIYGRSIKRLQKEVESARIKAKVGLAGPLDIYRAEIEVKEAEDNQVFTQSQVMRSKDRLKVLLSLPLQTQISVSAPNVIDKIDISLADAITTAMAKRMELQQIELDLVELERKITLARHNLQPQADVALKYNNNNLDPFNSRDNESSEYWSIQLVSSTDLARKREKATLTSQLLELKRKKLSAQEEKEKVKEDIGNQFFALSQAQKRLRIRQKQIGQSKRKLARATIKFRHGMADNFDIISSETELQRAQINLLKVETDYIVGTYRLRKKIGTLLDASL